MTRTDRLTGGDQIVKLRRDGNNILCDRCYFVLSEDAFRRFTAMLDRPPKDNPKLRRLLATKAPWERPR